MFDFVVNDERNENSHITIALKLTKKAELGFRYFEGCRVGFFCSLAQRWTKPWRANREGLRAITQGTNIVESSPNKSGSSNK
jgi:hypothetical protein